MRRQTHTKVNVDKMIQTARPTKKRKIDKLKKWPFEDIHRMFTHSHVCSVLSGYIDYHHGFRTRSKMLGPVCNDFDALCVFVYGPPDHYYEQIARSLADGNNRSYFSFLASACVNAFDDVRDSAVIGHRHGCPEENYLQDFAIARFQVVELMNIELAEGCDIRDVPMLLLRRIPFLLICHGLNCIWGKTVAGQAEEDERTRMFVRDLFAGHMLAIGNGLPAISGQQAIDTLLSSGPSGGGYANLPKELAMRASSALIKDISMYVKLALCMETNMLLVMLRMAELHVDGGCPPHSLFYRDGRLIVLFGDEDVGEGDNVVIRMNLFIARNWVALFRPLFLEDVSGEALDEYLDCPQCEADTNASDTCMALVTLPAIQVIESESEDQHQHYRLNVDEFRIATSL